MLGRRRIWATACLAALMGALAIAGCGSGGGAGGGSGGGNGMGDVRFGSDEGAEASATTTTARAVGEPAKTTVPTGPLADTGRPSREMAPDIPVGGVGSAGPFQYHRVADCHGEGHIGGARGGTVSSVVRRFQVDGPAVSMHAEFAFSAGPYWFEVSPTSADRPEYAGVASLDVMKSPDLTATRNELGDAGGRLVATVGDAPMDVTITCP